MLLRGYGSYGDVWDPYYDSSLGPLVSRGVIIATAHVRGGGFFGTTWYESGKLLSKNNTFLDFISVAEKLIELVRGFSMNVLS